MDKETKQKIILDNARSEGDTGSPEVQIALLTARINELTAHLDDELRNATTLSFHPNDCRGTVVIKREDFVASLSGATGKVLAKVKL